MENLPKPIENPKQGLEKYGYDREQINAIKDTVAKNATDAELIMFLEIAKKYNLDPFLREIWCIVTPEKPAYGQYQAKERSTLIMAGRDGYLKYAQNHPDFEYIKSECVKENDQFELDAVNGTIKHIIGTKRGAVVGAWCLIKLKSQKEPIAQYASVEDYAKASGAWQTHRAAMIKKVAQSITLKLVMGLTGLVSQEEMGYDKPGIEEAQYVDVTPEKPKTAPNPAPPSPVEKPALPPPPQVTPEQLAEMLAKARELAHSPEWTPREREIRVKYIEDNFNKYDLLRISVTKMEDQLADKRAVQESAKDLPADFQDQVKEGNQEVRKSREEFSALTGEIADILHNGVLPESVRAQCWTKYDELTVEMNFDKLSEFLQNLRETNAFHIAEKQTDALPV